MSSRRLREVRSGMAMGEPSPQELTVEQLAQRLDMSVRNLREYQALGLLPPPRRRGRVGYYGPAHVARLERVKELRDDGFPLDLIRRVLDAAGSTENDLVAFARTLREPFQDEEPEIVDAADLARRFGTTEVGVIDRSVELGLLRRRDDGRYEIPSPRLARVGDAMMAIGLTLAD